MAFAATAGDVPRVGWLLFLATVIWVVVYDTQYAMADRDDDMKIGVRSTAILFGELDRTFIVGLQLLLLASLVLVGRSADLGVVVLRRPGGGGAVLRLSGLSHQGARRRASRSALSSTTPGSAAPFSPVSCSTTCSGT